MERNHVLGEEYSIKDDRDLKQAAIGEWDKWECMLLTVPGS